MSTPSQGKVQKPHPGLQSAGRQRVPRISEPRELKHVSMIMSNGHGYTAISDSREEKTEVSKKILEELDRQGFQTEVLERQQGSGKSSEGEVYWTKALTDMGKKMARSARNTVARMSQPA